MPLRAQPTQDLEDLLRGSHPDGADSAIPCSTLDLLLHVVETHVDHLLDVVVELEMELDELERQLDSGREQYITLCSELELDTTQDFLGCTDYRIMQVS